MADPFSIALGVITLLDASAKCGSKIASLISEYRHVPDEILALSNEVQDFRLVLSQIQDASTRLNPASTAALAPLMQRARDCMVALLDFLNNFPMNSRRKQFFVWKKSKKSIIELKDHVRRLKEDINTILTAEVISSTGRIQTNLQAISFNFQLGQIQNAQTIRTCIDDGLSMQTALFTSLMQDQKNALVQIQHSIQNRPCQIQPTNIPQPSGDYNALPNSGTTVSTIDKAYHGRSDIISLRVSKRVISGCYDDCQCDCHRPKNSNLHLPQYIQNLLGIINIGYCGKIMPWAEGCSSDTCKRIHRSDITVTYQFPSWWAAKIATCNISCQGLSMQIAVRNTWNVGMPFNDFIKHLQQACRREFLDFDEKEFEDANFRDLMLDYKFMMELFQRRLISPLDYANYPDGERECLVVNAFSSILNSHEHAELLMQLVPSLQLPDWNGFTIASNLGDSLLDRAPYERDHDDPWYRLTRPKLFAYYSLYDAMELDSVHKASFDEFKIYRLDKILFSNPELVGAEDCFRRTPLHWACKKVHLGNIALLLSAGADPNARAENGRTPLHELCYTCTIRRGRRAFRNDILRAVKMLCAAGADVNIVDREGRTPLHTRIVSARYESRLSMRHLMQIVEVLCRAGSDLNTIQSCNGRSVLASALDISVRLGRLFIGRHRLTFNSKEALRRGVEILITKLLRDGAIINQRNVDGRIIILENKWDINLLPMLLYHGLDIEGEVNSSGEAVLFRLVDGYSLKRFPFMGVDTKHRSNDGHEVREVVKRRLDRLITGETPEYDSYVREFISFLDRVGERQAAHLSSTTARTVQSDAEKPASFNLLSRLKQITAPLSLRKPGTKDVNTDGRLSELTAVFLFVFPLCTVFFAVGIALGSRLK